MLNTSESVDPIVSALNSDAPPVPPRMDEMMFLSKESYSLPDSCHPIAAKIDLFYTPSSDQLSNKLTITLARFSVGPLYDGIQLTRIIIKPFDQTLPSGVSSDPTYAQPMHPTSSENTVSAPPATEPVVYDEVNKFQNSQVSKMAGVQVNQINLSLIIHVSYPHQGQHYAMLEEMPTSNRKPDNLVKTECAYSEIQPQSFRAAPAPSPDVTSVKPHISLEKCSATKGNRRISKRLCR